MINTRLFEENDHNEVIRLVRMFFDASVSEYGGVLSDEKISSAIEELKDTIFVLTSDDMAVGILGGKVISGHLSDEKVFHEMIWFVDKEFRGQGTELYTYAETVLRARGVKRMIMAAMYNSKHDMVVRFYKRRGYVPMETHMIKDITKGGGHA